MPDEAKPPLIAAYLERWGDQVKGQFQGLPAPSDHPVFRIEPTAREPTSLRAGHSSREHLSQDHGLTRERKV